MDNFGYMPDGTPTYGDALDARYPDYAEAPPAGQYGVPGQPYRPANRARPRPPVDERVAAGYPPQAPRRGYPPPPSGPRPAPPAPGRQPNRGYSGPMPAYRPESQWDDRRRADSGPMRAYSPDSGPMRAYSPDSGPMPAYRNDGRRTDSGPMRAYSPNSGPMRAYSPDSGPMPAYRPEAGSARGQRSASTTLIADYPAGTGPLPAFRPSGEMPVARDLLPGGKRVPGWLPFSNRLILLPKTAGAAGEELREHRDVNGGWLRPAVFGAMDGLVTNASLIAGIGGGGGGHGMIVLTGIAGLIAGAFSMATGEYISVTSQNELTSAEVDLERKQHARDPQGKRTRLTQVYVEKGVSPNLAEAVVRQISADPERAVATHVREELGIDPDDLPSPRTAAVASFASFTVGALIPLSPFLAGYPDLDAALVLAGVSAFAGGAAVAKLTGRSSVLGGLRQFTAAFLATGFAFLIGHLIASHVS
jgi:VIT1/CCC1 family predicted Fe2+/Mn2+ transporter